MSSQPKSVCFFRKLCKNRNKSRARDQHNPNISTPSTTTQLQPITHASGDAGHRDILVPPQKAQGRDASIPKQVQPGISTELRSAPAISKGRGAPSTSFFQGSSNVQMIKPSFNEIHGNATFIRFGDGEFTNVQRDLICDYIANLTVLPAIDDRLKKHVLTQLIISLPRAEAVFNDYQTKKKSGPCFEGTRIALLREMASWVTNQGTSKVYVLSGLAGIGKSTVAYTIASRAADLNLLGASFFFSRDEADRKNAKRFFTTIAYQLCVYNERFAEAIGNVLLTERGSAATTKDPQEQLNDLILDPLRSIVQSRLRPILIVVDALDECDEDDAFSVLTSLSQLVQDLPSFKVILTTRPQLHIDRFLSSEAGHKIFHLQDIEDKVVDSDIRLYLSHNLSMSQVQKRYPKRQWSANDEEIESLVHAAGRLFIIASTVVRYILDKAASNPAAQMQKLIRAFAEDHTPFKDLDHFYAIILRNVVPENCDDTDIASRYQSVVGAIIFVQRPLSVSILGHLIDIDADDIHAVLEHLQSVILLGDDDVPRIYHKSLPDYLTDPTRCKDLRLLIKPRICHTQIATRCFEIKNQYLKYNILNLSDLARFMSNEDGFKEDGITDEQLEERIPQQLRYACVHWANHLKVADVEDADLAHDLEKFTDRHILHWIEVLSLIEHLDLAHLAIRAVINLLKSTPVLHQLLSDALRFISKFYEIIRRSALHTYCSGLLFTPTNSRLHRRYIQEAGHSVYTAEDGPEQWDALVAVLNHEECVDAIKFSADSTMFMSYSEGVAEDDPQTSKQGKLKIWDAVTGTPISTIPGHRFAVANDFSTIVSSHDNIITYYNTNGSARATMFKTSSKIQKLAFSSESSRISAALTDGTVLLWDSENAKLKDSFEGFKANQSKIQLEFLPVGPTSTRLAYSSANGIVKLHDGIRGKFIADLQCGSEHDFNFTFSGDGSRIASIAYNDGLGHLTLWDSESGKLIDTVRVEVKRRCDIAVSANGSLLATSDFDGVQMWNENHGHLTKIDGLNLDGLHPIAFSVDNILATDCHFDDKTRLYDVETHSLISAFPIALDPAALAFSLDCTRLAIGNRVGTVFLREIQGIKSSPCSEEVNAVTALALSRDCSRLACGFSDGSVELRMINPTNQRIDPPASCSVREAIFRYTPHQSHFEGFVTSLGFSPDGRLFASCGSDGHLKLWNEDGTLRGTFEMPEMKKSVTVVLSNTVLSVGWSDFKGGATFKLWNVDSLSLIHIFTEEHGEWRMVSTAENDTLLAVFRIGDDTPGRVFVFDTASHATVATFDVPNPVDAGAFLPDNSRLVVQTSNGDLLTLNLVDKCIIKQPMLDHLIQLPNVPLWHGVPVLHDWDKELSCFKAPFSQCNSPVPVLWIPKDLHVAALAQGSSLITLGCEDGRVILLRIRTS